MRDVTAVETPGVNASDPIAALEGVVRDGDEAQVCFALEALAEIGECRTPDLIEAALGHPDPDVRAAAAAAAGGLGLHAAVPALVSGLREDPDSAVKLAAVEALGALRAEAAVPLLCELVRGRGHDVAWEDVGVSDWDDWLDVQIAAIAALGRIGDTQAAAAIGDALDDPDAQDLDAVAAQTLIGLGEPGVRVLATMVEASAPRRRRQAAQALAHATRPAPVALARRLLGHVDPTVRVAAIKAVATADPCDPELNPLAGDRDPEVRGTWAAACGWAWPAQLDTLLDDREVSVQSAAARVAANLGRTAPVPGLLDRLRRRVAAMDDTVALAPATVFIESLASLAPEVAGHDLGVLIQDTGRPADLRVVAARLLGELGGAAGAIALKAVVDDPERRVRIAAMTALARIAQRGNRDPGAAVARASILAALRGEWSPPSATEPDTSEGEAASQLQEEGARPETAAGGAGTTDTVENGQVTLGDQADLGGEGVVAESPQGPLSTLAAMQAEIGLAEDVPFSTADAGLTVEDVSRLESTGLQPRRKHLPLEPEIPKHQDVKQFATKVAGDIPDAEIARALAERLDGEEPDMILAAAESLARCLPAIWTQIPDVVTTTRQALETVDGPVRAALIRALAGHCETSARRGARDSDASVRRCSLECASLNTVDGETLEHGLADTDFAVRRAAIPLYARFHGDRAVDRLVDMALAHGGLHREDIARAMSGEAGRAALATCLGNVLCDESRRRQWRFAAESLRTLLRGTHAGGGRLAPVPPAIDPRVVS